MTAQTDSVDIIEQLRQRIATVLRDLQDAGVNDPEAISMIGTLAYDLTTKLEAASWRDAKQALTDQGYGELLYSFEKNGNSLYKDGKVKQAYAIQAMAISLVASRHRGQKRIAEGEQLLDGVIDAALSHVRRLRAQAN